MATIEERINGDGSRSYRVKVRLHGHPAVTETFPTRTEAKRWGGDTEAAIRAGRFSWVHEASRKTLADAIDRYLSDLEFKLEGELPVREAKHVRKRMAELRFWRAALGEYRIASVTPARIIEVRDQLRRNVSPATINRRLAALSVCFRLAIEWEIADDNPVRRIRRETEPQGRERYLDPEERERLLAACRASEEPRLYALTILALWTGARQSELLGLTWRDVDLARGRVSFRETKNGRDRSVAVRGQALELLREWSRVRRIDSPFVFVAQGRRTSSASAPEFPRPAWRDAVKAAKVEDFRFHDLRHSCASYLAMTGATATDIRDVLGHSSLAPTSRYTHLTQGHLDNVLAGMQEKVLNGGRENA